MQKILKCNVEELEVLFAGVEKGLHIQQVKNEALLLLLHASSQYYVKNVYSRQSACCYQFHLRSRARKVLNNFIDDSLIQRKLRTMLIEEPLLQLKMELLNMLEGQSAIASDLEKGRIISNLSSTWNMFDFFKIQESAIRKFAFNALLDLIQDKKNDMQQRIIAIRYLSNYFITYSDYSFSDWESFLSIGLICGDEAKRLIVSNQKLQDKVDQILKNLNKLRLNPWSGDKYEGLILDHNLLEDRPTIKSIKQFILEQQSYRQKILSFLTEFIKSHPVDEILRTEASSLLHLIMSHLEYIYNDGLSCSDYQKRN